MTPYVGRNKNDQQDAKAICEAMSRPQHADRFVPHKTVEQQSLQMLVKVREGLVKRRTQVSNKIRGHAAEYGFVCAKGLIHLDDELAKMAESRFLPEQVRDLFAMLEGQYRHCNAQIRETDKKLMVLHRDNEMSLRLAEVPSIGPIGAMVLTAKAIDIKRFKSARDFAAWLGLTPKDHSTAVKRRMGGITRAGDEMTRSILVAGATSVLQQVMKGRSKCAPWLEKMAKEKPFKVVAVALANRTARIAWKMMITGERYRPGYMPEAAAAPQAAAPAAAAVDMWATPDSVERPVALSTCPQRQQPKTRGDSVLKKKKQTPVQASA